jgi:AraC family transcriptional regulator of adaptative response/methylated-DNA-[protein]-cysteine methyltransferase
METVSMSKQTDPDPFPTDEAKWTAINRRDKKADGHFYFSVKTTGVYCRPSCPSRMPLRKNVAFHATPQEAEAAGWRSCKRCRPKGPTLHEEYAATVAKACRFIEAAEEAPALAAVAKKVGMSPHHFHRVFKAITGLTPKGYARAHQAKTLRDRLPKAGSVTEAIYDSGFNSSGRFYAHSEDALGMKPADFRHGGANNAIRFAVAECSLGSVLVAASPKGVCAVLLGNDPILLVRDLQDKFPKADLIGGDGQFEETVAKVIAYIEAPRTGFDLPLDVQGTAFQQKVWKALRQIPAGKTVSYADIARKIGEPKAFRAVAQACGANSLAVVVPCHRVVRKDGGLSGYRWGVDRKKALLLKETA